MSETPEYIQIFGTVRAVLFQNEENGYTVIKLETDDGELKTAVGCLPFAAAGEQLILTGRYTKHPSYGEQFSAEYAERSMPVGAEAIYEYLSSGVIKGVGPATATLLVNEFGDTTLDIMERCPEKLAQIRGISSRKAAEISRAFRAQRGVRALMELLGGHGIRPEYALRLFRVYGDSAMDRVEFNPYVLSTEMIGATFAEADELALAMGFEPDCAERVAAAVLFELNHNSGNGHVFLPTDKLIAATCQLIGVDPMPVEEALTILCDEGQAVRCVVAELDVCYLSCLYEAETYAAERVKKMSGQKLPCTKAEKLISAIESEQSISFADLQLFALKVAATRRIMVLTGGPGTGKTTTVRGIVSLFDKLELNTLLTAPTGRAAKRMSELAGRDASTVHRLLEAGYSQETDTMVFKRDGENPLECDAVILDECSMVDITLFCALLRAMPEDCRLILVGDADQLPSVGPGFVFNDVIRSGIVETVRLTEIFRQSDESRIVANAHIINRGDYPELNANKSDSDFFFLRRSNAADAVETVLSLCADRLPKRMGIPKRDIQVLSPTRRGETGTANLNACLQRALNPPTETKKEKKFGEIVFRTGDRVMQIRNNYDIIWQRTKNVAYIDDDDGAGVPVITFEEKPEQGMGIFNGDVGIILGINEESETISVLYDDRVAWYDYDMLSELEHAYAITVHKSQGSEYRAVVLLALDGSPQLLNRTVLYTAVTRARELLIIVGSENTVCGMIDNHKVTRRYSGLRARLVES